MHDTIDQIDMLGKAIMDLYWNPKHATPLAPVRSNVSDGFEKLCRAIKEHQEAQRVQQVRPSMEPLAPTGVAKQRNDHCRVAD